MVAKKSAENTPKCPKTYLPKLFGISLKKRLHWASVVRGVTHVRVTRVGMEYHISFQKILDQIVATIKKIMPIKVA